MLPAAVANWFDWSHDGQRVVGLQDDGTVVERGLDAAGETRVRTKIPAAAGQQPQDLSPDGQMMLFVGSGLRGVFSADLTDTSPAPPVKTLVDENILAFDARFSPDGRSILYSIREGGGSSLFIQPFPGPGRRRQVAQVGTDPEWRRDGKEILYLGPERGVWAVAIEGTGNDATFGKPVRLFGPVRIQPAILALRQLALSADGTRIFLPEAIEQPDAGVIHVTNVWLHSRR
jgi:Tol biopolymer transport system component